MAIQQCEIQGVRNLRIAIMHYTLEGMKIPCSELGGSLYSHELNRLVRLRAAERPPASVHRCQEALPTRTPITKPARDTLHQFSRGCLVSRSMVADGEIVTANLRTMPARPLFERDLFAELISAFYQRTHRHSETCVFSLASFHFQIHSALVRNPGRLRPN